MLKKELALRGVKQAVLHVEAQTGVRQLRLRRSVNWLAAGGDATQLRAVDLPPPRKPPKSANKKGFSGGGGGGGGEKKGAFRKINVMRYKELRPRAIEQDPSKLDKYIGWYMSQKIDGWQAIWDGKSTMYTKTFKRKFAVPASWLQLLPKVALTGEIKIRGEPATTTAHLLNDGPDWKNTQFHVFDVVGKKYRTKPFSERVAVMKSIVKKACRQTTPKCPLICAQQKIARKRSDILSWYKKVLRKGGEGLVLTNPSSEYSLSGKRVPTRVKLKGRNDSEGTVVGWTRGWSKDKSSLKSLKVKFNHVTFNLGIGFKFSERRNYKKLFPKGTTVSFSYRQLSSGGKPKEARFVRVRQDV